MPNITIKRYIGNGVYQELYPKTTPEQIVASGIMDSSTFLRGDGVWSAVSWSNLQNKPTTISGFGITDAYTKTEVDNKLAGKSDNGHTHDARYYTETEIDSMLQSYVNKHNGFPLITTISGFPHFIGYDQTNNLYLGIAGDKYKIHHDGNSTGYWKKIRSRSSGTALSSGSSFTCTENFTQGDKLMIEVSDSSSATSNIQLLTVTVGRITSTPDSTNENHMTGWTIFNGTNLITWSFAFSAYQNTFRVGSFKKINGAFSGTTISWNTTSTYTLYVGNIWKLVE